MLALGAVRQAFLGRPGQREPALRTVPASRSSASPRVHISLVDSNSAEPAAQSTHVTTIASDLDTSYDRVIAPQTALVAGAARAEDCG
jgi:hypothetical protein